MSRSKDGAATKAVLEYLNRQNRPYSTIDICNNLHKEFGKTAIVKACEELSEMGKIREKVYGKQKVYVVNQVKYPDGESQLPDVNDSELSEMDKTIAEMTESLKNFLTEVSVLERELKNISSTPTTDEASCQLADLTRQCDSCTEKLMKLKKGQVLISKEQKDKVYKERVKYVKEWKQRKRMANEILGAILEGYPKSKKQLLEDIGVETDEECNMILPNI